jgi:hypothetical protein
MTPRLAIDQRINRPSMTTPVAATITTSGSTKMYTMYESLARDRMRERESHADRHRAVRELQATRRVQRLERRVRLAEQRASAATRRNALRAV